MTLNFPADLERDLALYARSEQISVEEAAVKLVQRALQTGRRKEARMPPTDAQWDQLREIDPGFAFLRGCRKRSSITSRKRCGRRAPS